MSTLRMSRVRGHALMFATTPAHIYWYVTQWPCSQSNLSDVAPAAAPPTVDFTPTVIQCLILLPCLSVAPLVNAELILPAAPGPSAAAAADADVVVPAVCSRFPLVLSVSLYPSMSSC